MELEGKKTRLRALKERYREQSLLLTAINSALLDCGVSLSVPPAADSSTPASSSSLASFLDGKPEVDLPHPYRHAGIRIGNKLSERGKEKAGELFDHLCRCSASLCPREEEEEEEAKQASCGEKEEYLNLEAFRGMLTSSGNFLGSPVTHHMYAVFPIHVLFMFFLRLCFLY